MPVLAAREAMELAERFAVGSGAMKPEDARRAWRTWQRAAAPGIGRTPQPRTVEDFAQMGIGVKVVPRGN